MTSSLSVGQHACVKDQRHQNDLPPGVWSGVLSAGPPGISTSAPEAEIITCDGWWQNSELNSIKPVRVVATSFYMKQSLVLIYPLSTQSGWHLRWGRNTPLSCLSVKMWSHSQETVSLEQPSIHIDITCHTIFVYIYIFIYSHSQPVYWDGFSTSNPPVPVCNMSTSSH